MKDLKHLYYFEHLLDDANNELVREARAKGQKALGNVCYTTPEPLLNLEGCFGVRLRAPRTGSLEMGTYYMTSFLCEYTRALLERAIEGGFQFLDALFGVDGCSMINRCVENMELLKTNTKDGFFMTYMEGLMKSDENALNLNVSECRRKILDPLKEHFGVDTSDEALRKAVEKYNRMCRVINALGEFRKEDNPRITGYEFHIITMCTYVAPWDLLMPKLEETLEEVKTREPDTKKKFRARVAVVGSEVDDVDMIKLIEDSGAEVVADRYCLGSLPGREEIHLTNDGDVLRQICAHYVNRNMCPRHMDSPKMKARKDYVNQIVQDYKCDGVIYEQMKFCDPWAYERMTGVYDMRENYKIPVLAIDRPYAVGASGQIRTRVQAFVESIEIKKIQGGNK